MKSNREPKKHLRHEIDIVDPSLSSQRNQKQRDKLKFTSEGQQKGLQKKSTIFGF